MIDTIITHWWLLLAFAFFLWWGSHGNPKGGSNDATPRDRDRKADEDEKARNRAWEDTPPENRWDPPD